MRRSTLIFLLFAAARLSAQADAEQVFRHRQEKRPPAGETHTATVGEPAFEEIDQREYLWAEARSEIKGGGVTLLPAGITLWAWHQKDTAKEFCSWGEHGRFCFWDDDGSGTFDRVKVIGGNRISGVSGSYREMWKPGDDPDRSRRWELVYLGAGGGVLRLSAREYRGSAAAPATASDVTYDLAATGSTRFRFRGVEIEVLSADNSGLTYRVSGPSTKP
jgi:hypothetical protein